jgi:hypothetical protein
MSSGAQSPGKMSLGGRRTLLAGLSVGSVGLLTGYFAPLVMFPQSNLGPLFGIIFAGPAGFVVGVILGLICGFFRLTTRAFATLVLVVAASIVVATVCVLRLWG